MFTIRTKTKMVVARVKFIGFRLFLVSLGVCIGANGMFVYFEAPKLLEPQKMTFENVPMVYPVQAKETEKKSAVFTAYSAGDGYTPGTVMASGKTVYVGAVACPRDMKLGTRLEVESVGIVTCEDRKSLKHPDSFDIYKDSVGEALHFGKQVLEYTIIK